MTRFSVSVPETETPIDRLRALGAALEANEQPAADVARWAAAAIRDYETEAPAGLTLDKAFGLVPQPGHACWWTFEEQRRGDDALRRLRNEHFPDLGMAEAARQIAKLMARRSRQKGDLPRFGDQIELVQIAIETGRAHLSRSRIKKILGAK